MESCRRSAPLASRLLTLAAHVFIAVESASGALEPEAPSPAQGCRSPGEEAWQVALEVPTLA